MPRKFSRAAFACLLGLLMCGTSLAAPKTYVIPPQACAGGRDVHVIVAQVEIHPNINRSNVNRVSLGLVPVVPSLIDLAIENERANRAEIPVLPLRTALASFDFDARAQSASAAALANLGWFEAKQRTFSKDDSADAMVAVLDAITTPQLLLMEYRYETTPGFTAMIVDLEVSLVNKKIPMGKKSTSRLYISYLPYNQSVRSIIQLRDANPEDGAANLQTWSADDGRAARAALALGIEQCQRLLERVMSLPSADAISLRMRNDRRMTRVPGIIGWVIESDATYSLIFEPASGKLIHVQTFGTPATALAAPAQ